MSGRQGSETVLDRPGPVEGPDPQATSPLPAPGHHSSHIGLLNRNVVAPSGTDGVDAVIVPTARTSAYLRDALNLARQLDCPLLALCSRWSTADQAYREARAAGAHLVATDFDAAVRLPPFATSTLVDGGRFGRTTDTSLKRNIGIAVALMVGWRRVVFVDDDITDIQPHHIGAAVRLLDDYDMVALENKGFPDNSVVCHALRAVQEYQDSFVGGGAMAVKTDESSSFFPNIY